MRGDVPTDGLVGFVDTLRARFEERGLDVEIFEGREALVGQMQSGSAMNSRIAIYDLDDAGSVEEPTRVGEDDEDSNRRPLWRATTPLGVAIVGFDANQPDRYFAHRDRCLVLWEALAQEVWRLASNVHRWASWSWNTKRRHGAYGAEITATLLLELVLRDVSNDSIVARPKPGAPKPA